MINLTAIFQREKPQKDYLLENIKSARSDLERAEALFNEMTDSEAIDFAVYSILAAKSRYSYLIAQAKKRDLNSKL